MKKVIFDVDGVLLSEERYFDVSALTVWELLYSKDYMGLPLEGEDFDARHVTEGQIASCRSRVWGQDRLLAFLKAHGINSNWDMVHCWLITALWLMALTYEKRSGGEKVCLTLEKPSDMKEAGLALMGTGMASGENRAREAAQRAIMSPLLEDVSLESAKAVLYNITAPMDITAEEIAEIGDIIGDATPEDANIIFGVVFDENIGDEIRLTVIATGIESPQAVQPVQAPVASVTNFRQPGPDAVMAEPRRRQLGRPQQQGNLVQEPQDEPEMRLPRATRRSEVERWYDEKSNRPPYLLKREAMGQSRRRPHNPGQDDFTYDEDDFEIPTFIRTQAD